MGAAVTKREIAKGNRSMKNGKCPKCESVEIRIFIAASANKGGLHGNILMDKIPLGFMKAASLEHYVCKKCGYLEHYIRDDDIAKL